MQEARHDGRAGLADQQGADRTYLPEQWLPRGCQTHLGLAMQADRLVKSGQRFLALTRFVLFEWSPAARAGKVASEYKRASDKALNMRILAIFSSLCLAGTRDLSLSITRKRQIALPDSWKFYNKRAGIAKIHAKFC